MAYLSIMPGVNYIRQIRWISTIVRYSGSFFIRIWGRHVIGQFSWTLEIFSDIVRAIFDLHYENSVSIESCTHKYYRV